MQNNITTKCNVQFILSYRKCPYLILGKVGIEDKKRRKSILQEIKKTHFNKSLASKIK